jgi:hypothetical protein
VYQNQPSTCATRGGRRARSRRSRRLVEEGRRGAPHGGGRARSGDREKRLDGSGETAACVGSVAADPRARGGGGGRLEADPRSVKKDRRNSSLIPILFRSRDMGVSTRVLGVGRYAVTRAVRFVETPVFTVKKIMCLRGAHHPNLESIRF